MNGHSVYVVYHQQQWIGVADTWLEAIMLWERWAAAAYTHTRLHPNDRDQRIEERRGMHPGWGVRGSSTIGPNRC